jgi:hypothetical protein
VPLFEREKIECPKNRPFTGSYISNVNQNAIFHNVDIFLNTKSDKLLILSSKYHIKLEFLKNNLIYRRQSTASVRHKERFLRTGRIKQDEQLVHCNATHGTK